MTIEEEDEDELNHPSGRMATGVEESSKEWSVPKFGEDDPTLPDIPSTRNSMGARVITPATISCYPLLGLETLVPDETMTEDELTQAAIRVKNLNRYRG